MCLQLGGVSGIDERKEREEEGERERERERGEGEGERERKRGGGREREGERETDVIFVSSALELQPDYCLTMYYCGEVLGRQGKKEDSRDMFKLAAQTEIAIH